MSKRERPIIQMFHPIGKDERLLDVANDIEVLNAPSFPIFKHFEDYLSFI